MECHNCGNIVEEMDEFCSECGSNIAPKTEKEEDELEFTELRAQDDDDEEEEEVEE